MFYCFLEWTRTDLVGFRNPRDAVCKNGVVAGDSFFDVVHCSLVESDPNDVWNFLVYDNINYSIKKNWDITKKIDWLSRS